MAASTEPVEFRIVDLDITRLFLFELEQVILRLDREGNPEAERIHNALKRWNGNLGGADWTT